MFSPFLVLLSVSIGVAIILVGLVLAAYERIREGTVSCLAIGIVFAGLAFLLFIILSVIPQ